MSRFISLSKGAEQGQEALVPLAGTPFYVTPDEPASPLDCDRFADSPFCGGNPFSLDILNLDIGIVKDDCNLGIQLQVTLGFVKTPPNQIVLRNPECNKPKMPKPPGPNERGERIRGIDSAIDRDASVYVFYGANYFYKKEEKNTITGQVFPTSVSNFLEVKNFKCPGETLIRPFGNIPLAVSCEPSRKRIVQAVETEYFGVDHGTQPVASYNYEQTDSMAEPYGMASIGEAYFTATFYLDAAGRLGYARSKGGHIFHDNRYKIPNAVYGIEVTNSFAVVIFRGQWKHIKNFLENPEGAPAAENIATKNAAILMWFYAGCKPPSKKPPHLPPPPKRCTCMASCCGSNRNDDNELLRKIYALLQLVNKKIGEPNPASTTVCKDLKTLVDGTGVKDLPAKLPKRLVYPNGKGEEKPKTLLEVMGYQIKQLDRAVGPLPKTIKVTDTNPAQAGNQSIEVEIHSLADIGAETLKYLIDTEGDGDTTNNMLVRVLYELGFVHQLNVQIAAMCDAMVEHLDFKHKWKQVKVPFAFNPYAGVKKAGKGFGKLKDDAKTEEQVEASLPELLQNTNVSIRVLDNEDKGSLSDVLQEIRRNAAAAAAAGTEVATPERLKQMVEAAQLVLKMQGAIDRENYRSALTSGSLVNKRKS